MCIFCFIFSSPFYWAVFLLIVSPTVTSTCSLQEFIIQGISRNFSNKQLGLIFFSCDECIDEDWKLPLVERNLNCWYQWIFLIWFNALNRLWCQFADFKLRIIVWIYGKLFCDHLQGLELIFAVIESLASLPLAAEPSVCTKTFPRFWILVWPAFERLFVCCQNLADDSSSAFLASVHNLVGKLVDKLQICPLEPKIFEEDDCGTSGEGLCLNDMLSFFFFSISWILDCGPWLS